MSPHSHTHTEVHAHRSSHMADMLDLDAAVLKDHLEEVISWVASHAPSSPRTVVDLGAGTGTGTLALAQRFATADLVALDVSPTMLDRLRTAARSLGLTRRLRIVEADLDQAWPEVGGVDVVWAASSLHHLSDADRALRDVHAALAPGGLLAVIEMDSHPRFLPQDIGLGQPGLEERCRQAVAGRNWNAHPNWHSHLESAGFEVLQQRIFAYELRPAPPAAGLYAHTYFGRLRDAVADQLGEDDLRVLDALLAEDGPDSLLHRPDLRVRGSRTAWAARKA
ncbi:class I SAM-dependent methyltransferase [Natronoglycomyces albus]|uniref:Class I SAM-dependent methyltransferase n=1 Tax=Natronoglycomyces albus TaxID=2811108 RepID=A0A895XR47_9ACTN|nr:class I SAM-dependent methyltransferase [Natronoglycomyces albus]QSB05635.1 class I SAM-dependent methyltransferase [Natronoglycomyces albus]